MRKASEIELLLMSCTTIWFSPGEQDKQGPEIILGFEDEVSGPIAYEALRKWVTDADLIIALNKKEELIEATLIHTGTYEAATIAQIRFNNNNLKEFVTKVSPDRRLGLYHCINRGQTNHVHENEPRLTLLRYILVISGSGPQ